MTGSIVTLSVEEWQQKAEEGLPPAADAIERNAEITARYVGWYLREPDLFKWAGMAAFASRQVGVAIGLDAVSAGLFHDLEIIRVTNNLVYSDIAWAHLAYEHGGSSTIESAIKLSAAHARAAGTPAKDYSLLQKGFALIDRAR